MSSVYANNSCILITLGKVLHDGGKKRANYVKMKYVSAQDCVFIDFIFICWNLRNASRNSEQRKSGIHHKELIRL